MPLVVTSASGLNGDGYGAPRPIHEGVVLRQSLNESARDR